MCHLPWEVIIAFAKRSFLMFPLHPAGGEGQGEGGRKKLLATSIATATGIIPLPREKLTNPAKKY
jgi:hypothetical protein